MDGVRRLQPGSMRGDKKKASAGGWLFWIADTASRPYLLACFLWCLCIFLPVLAWSAPVLSPPAFVVEVFVVEVFALDPVSVLVAGVLVDAAVFAAGASAANAEPTRPNVMRVTAVIFLMVFMFAFPFS